MYREAYRNDQVCVPPATRARVRADNATAAGRIQPNGAYGPKTCKSGWVWREARPADQVCVTPAQREQARTDNALAASRRISPPGAFPTRTPAVAVGSNGRPLPPGSTALAQCRIGRATCPPRMQPLYDEVSVSCLCHE